MCRVELNKKLLNFSEADIVDIKEQVTDNVRWHIVEGCVSGYGLSFSSSNLVNLCLHGRKRWQCCIRNSKIREG